MNALTGYRNIPSVHAPHGNIHDRYDETRNLPAGFVSLATELRGDLAHAHEQRLHHLRVAARHDAALSRAIRRVSERNLCDALRHWCDTHDPVQRASARRWVRRETAQVRNARRLTGTSLRRLSALTEMMEAA